VPEQGAAPLAESVAPGARYPVPVTCESPDRFNAPSAPIPASPKMVPEASVTVWASSSRTVKALAAPRPAKVDGHDAVAPAAPTQMPGQPRRTARSTQVAARR